MKLQHCPVLPGGLFRRLLVSALLLAPIVGNAALQPVGSGQLVNDPDHNLTWLADANLFLTQANLSGDPAGFVTEIISDWGQPFTTSKAGGANGFSYTLSSADFDTTSGAMTWFGATAWINYLNLTNYQGYSDWRAVNVGDAGTVPGICGGACYPSTSGSPISSSEWWELFFLELGGVERVSIQSSHNSSFGFFTNVQLGSYWAQGIGNDSVNTFTDVANGFSADSAQQEEFTNIMQFGWAVRTGQSVASPPPMAHIVLKPSTMLNFGDQQVGTKSATQAVAISSTGTGAAALTIAVTGDFAESDDCPAELAPGASCAVNISFNPTEVNERSGVLTVSTGADQTVQLSGTGAIAVSLTSSVPNVSAGTATTLTWSSTSGSSCTASGGAPGDGWGGAISSNGSQSVVEATAGTYVYTVTCSQGALESSAKATVIDAAAIAGGGGGGSLDLVCLAMMGLLALAAAVGRKERR